MFRLFKRLKGPTDRPLTESEQREVKNYCRDAIELVGVGHKASPDEMQSEIYDYINAYRESALSPEEGVDMALAIGCLWGFATCRQLKWQWAFVEQDGDGGFYAIVSPGREYVVYPMLFVQKLLTNPAADQTSLLLYNMLKAGKLPPTPERSYLVLS